MNFDPRLPTGPFVADNRCLNCGADLSVVRVSACCESPQSDAEVLRERLANFAAQQHRDPDLDAILAKGIADGSLYK